jgi:hypothetical protein
MNETPGVPKQQFHGDTKDAYRYQIEQERQTNVLREQVGLINENLEILKAAIEALSGSEIILR